MFFNRRNFLRSASVLATLSFTEMEVIAAMKQIQSGGKSVNDTDEKYWNNVRQLFPLTHDFTYLNNGTMGPSPYPVIEAVKNGMMDGDHHGSYGGWEHTAKKLAAFVGANEDEIALTHNVTDGINITCWGVPLRRGDEVILTTHEHVGNAFPWLNRRKLHGIVIKTFTPASTADETLNRIAALITKRTRVIAVPHIPCTQGQILPAKEICKLAREKGIYSIIDGAHGPGMLMLDLHDMGCDTYATCSHKWMLGPKGTGFLYVRKDFQQTLQTYFVGGGSDNGKWNMALDTPKMGKYADNAHRYYGGTQALGLYKGVDAAIDFIETIGMQNIHNRIKSLGAYTQQQLLSLGDRVELITPTEERSRCAVNGFRIKGVEYTKFYDQCSTNKIRIRTVAENGLNSLRVSTHIYNNRAEVDLLIEQIKKAIG
ncbi:MAG: aminotransferase class V-fold PLP-dependent enzyme [Flavipsychrobacter sp.]|nr:aminotransferase class V-fold PLP-dependent enzyme [Flavipsychrobacter sp.]